MINQIKNPTFGGFKPDAMQRIAGTLGYTGDMSGFQQYLEQNPEKRTQMDQFKQAAMTMAKGGAVRKYQEGGMGVPKTPIIAPTPEQPKPTDITPTPVEGFGVSIKYAISLLPSPLVEINCEDPIYSPIL